jgi:hypothetical protein
MIISLEGVLRAVEKMREAQTAYSKKRTPEMRDTARAWERLVDEYIREVNAETAAAAVNAA